MKQTSVELEGALRKLGESRGHEAGSSTNDAMLHAQIAAIIESSDDAVFCTSLDGLVLSWNSGAERMFGYTGKEMSGQPSLGLLPENKRNIENEGSPGAFQGKPGTPYETVRRRKNGAHFTVQLRESPILGAGGRAIATLSIARDITEAKNLETFREGRARIWRMVGQKAFLQTILQDLAELLQSLIANSRIAIMLVSDDGKQLHRCASAGLPEFFLQAVDCMPVQALAPSCAVAALTRKLVLSSDMAADAAWHGLREITGMYNLHACCSYPIVNTVDQALGTIDVYFNEQRVPTFAEIRMLEQSADLARGVLEQRMADMEAAKAREQSKFILEQFDSAVFSYDVVKQRFIHLSSAVEKIFGRTIAELHAQPQLLSGNEVYSGPELLKLILTQVEKHKTDLIEYKVTTPKGETKWLECRLLLIGDDSNQVQEIHGIIYDITGRRALEAELQAKSKLAVVGLLAAGVAHEIGNPLAFVSARLQRLLAKAESPFVSESVAMMQTQVDRIAATLRKMSGFTRSRGQLWTRCDVNELVEETIDIIRLDARSLAVEIAKDIAPGISPINVVREQLHQVFINLGLNALAAMPNGGRLVIATQLDQGELVVSFCDTGIGIPSAVRDRIFDPFFSTKESGRNMGLGLYLSLTFVKAHGGAIVCQSEEGHGTTFSVRLPLHSAETPRKGL